MSKTDPIRNLKDLQKMKELLLSQERWGDVHDFSRMMFYQHVYVIEQKTQKNIITLNKNIFKHSLSLKTK